MSDTRDLQTNFSGGELSPTALGLFDSDKYRNGARKIDNFVCRPSGGMHYRSGFIWAARASRIPSDTNVRAIPFFVDEDEGFLLVFGQTWIEVFKNGVRQVYIRGSYTWDDLPDIRYAQSFDVMYLVHPNHPPRELKHFDDTTWTLSDMDIEVPPFLSSQASDLNTTLSVYDITDRRTLTNSSAGFSGVNVNDWVEYPVNGYIHIGKVTAKPSNTEITVAPYEDLLVDDVADSVYITQVSTSNIVLSNSGVLRGSDVGKILHLPYKNSSTKIWFLVSSISGDTGNEANGTRIMPVATSGSVSSRDRTIIASIRSSQGIFDSNDGFTWLRLHFKDQVVVARITNYVTTSVVDVRLNRGMPPIQSYSHGTNDWRWSAWYNGNWPTDVYFMEQRLVMQASNEQPNAHWESVTGSFYDFSTVDDDSQVLDSSGINYLVDTSNYSKLRWLIPGRVTILASDQQVFRAGSDNLSTPITPRNFRVVEESSFGTINVQPVRVGPAVIYVQNDNRNIRELVYNFEIDAHLSRQINIFSEHILRDHQGCSQIIFMDTPDPILYFVCNDGKLVVMTYIRDQDFVAFSTFSHGGSLAKIKAMAVVPSPQGDRLYAIVDYGSNYVSVEYLGPLFLDTSTIADMVYVDGAVNVSGSRGQQFAFEHLANQVVRPVLDGEALPAVTLNEQGAYTLPRDTAVGWLGVPYRGLFRSLPIMAPDRSGAGLTRRIRTVTLMLYHSLGFKYGSNLDNLYEESVRSTEDPTDAVPPFFTGERKLFLTDSEPTLNPEYFVVQDDPNPLNILGAYLELTIN